MRPRSLPSFGLRVSPVAPRLMLHRPKLPVRRPIERHCGSAQSISKRYARRRLARLGRRPSPRRKSLMPSHRNRLCRLSVVAATVVLLSADPSLAQNVPVPCSAFARHTYGGWSVLAPVMLYIDGRLRAPTVGTTFPPGVTINGIKMSDVLDRECGNGQVLRPGGDHQARSEQQPRPSPAPTPVAGTGPAQRGERTA